MFDILIIRLTALITLGLGTILIVQYPLLKDRSLVFARISLLMGILLIVILLIILFGDPNSAYDIFID